MGVLLSSTAAFSEEVEIELEAAKDNFARSSVRNGNSGANPEMFIVPVREMVALIAFDLSAVTNEIVSASFSFRIMETNDQPISLTVAPMVAGTNNASWVEGTGNLGALGQNATLGESTYQWRSFRDASWEDQAGKPVLNLADPKLWNTPIARKMSVDWIEGNWVTVSISDLSFLEEIIEGGSKIVTFGLWGTAGNEFYRINARESGEPARLVLKLNVPEPETQP
ncbi:hypothetical protein P4E94_01405 [Pontiellaceae bacterium B12219]|nr:hypothetical protein [Pontiellaceae bacterium B12219]